MKKAGLTAFLMLLIGVLAFALYPAWNRKSLRLYAGAGMRPAVEKLIEVFGKETGIQVEADYGGSGMILSRAREDRHADLFFPGDEWYVDRLHELSGTVAERVCTAYFIPVIVVARGNPKNVRTLADLARPDLRIGLGKPDACQVGRVSERMLKTVGLDYARLKPQESLTVNELGVWVKMNAVDAAIVWDAMAATMANDVDTVEIPPAQMIVSKVVLARLAGSRNPGAARQFLAFVTGPQGQAILEEAGYRVTPPASITRK